VFPTIWELFRGLNTDLLHVVTSALNRQFNIEITNGITNGICCLQVSIALATQPSGT